MRKRSWLLAATALLFSAHVRGQVMDVEITDISSAFPGGYQITVADVDGDGHEDIVALGWRVSWFRSPDWKEFPITGEQTERNINLAAYDLNGDDELEFAVASQFSMQHTGEGGLVQWFRRPADLTRPWIPASIDAEPTSHRLRWADLEGRGKKFLVNSPIMGPDTKAPTYDQAGARLCAYRVPEHLRNDSWPKVVIDTTLPVTHALETVDWDGDGRDEILTGSRDGVHLFRFKGEGANLSWTKKRLCQGNQDSNPSKGASEIHVGTLASGERFLTTIEPWHGNQVAVYLKDRDGSLWNRTVIDESFEEGHALWTADLDQDGSDEVYAGFRGSKPGVIRYRNIGAERENWEAEVIDTSLLCQSLSEIQLPDGSSALLAIGSSSIRMYRFP